MKSAPALSIIVVTYNNVDWVERCLGAIPGATGQLDYEIVVVDNASADDSAELVRTKFPQAALLVNETNVGFAAAVNQGVAASGGAWVLLLNPDAEVKPGAIQHVYDFAQDKPGHGVYGGRLLYADGSLDPRSCWGLPTLWSTFCFASGLSTALAGSEHFDPESLGRWQRDTVREVGMVAGCFLLTPRGLWDELGGLDEYYFVYGEDTDFSARARKLGYRPIIDPQAQVYHEGAVSSSDETSKTVLLLAGRLSYLRRQIPGVRGRLAVWLLRLGVLLRAVGARVTGRGAKWLGAWRRRSGWWDGFDHRYRTTVTSTEPR